MGNRGTCWTLGDNSRALTMRRITVDWNGPQLINLLWRLHFILQIIS